MVLLSCSMNYRRNLTPNDGKLQFAEFRIRCFPLSCQREGERNRALFFPGVRDIAQADATRVFVRVGKGKRSSFGCVFYANLPRPSPFPVVVSFEVWSGLHTEGALHRGSFPKLRLFEKKLHQIQTKIGRQCLVDKKWD